MTELIAYEPNSEIGAIPAAAHALVEWAQSADAAYQLAEKLCNTAFAPSQYKSKPVEAAAAMLAGAEVGLSPMASLRAFDVIQGVAAPRALAIRAIAQSQGHEIITDTATEDKVVMRGKRRGATEWQTVTWTIQRAAKLGLTGKDQWKKQPQTMLIARATTELVRLIAADAVLGIGYSIEEIGDADLPTTKVTRSVSSTKVSRSKPVETVSNPQDDTTPSEPLNEPADTGEGMSVDQQKKMFAQFGELGIKERDDYRDYISKVVGTEVESSKDLTAEQASRVIESQIADLEAAEVVDAELPIGGDAA